MVVVTNQAGIARGYFSEDVLAAVNATLVSQLKDEGAYLDGIYVCTHHPTAGEPPYRMVCDCRKPARGCCFARPPSSASISRARRWSVTGPRI